MTNSSDDLTSPFATRSQLLATGMTRHALDDPAARDRPVAKLGRGLFLVRDEDVTTWEQRVRRALIQAGSQAVASRETAARLLGISGTPTLAEIQLCIPKRRSTPFIQGVDIKRVDLPPEDVGEAQGCSVTAPLRTVVDCGRYSDLVTAVCVIESSCRQELTTLADIAERLASMHRAPGVVAARFALERADLRSESPLETALRLLLVEAGLPTPELQLPFVCEGINGRIDLAYPAPLLGVTTGAYVGLAIEADGREAHSEPEAFEHDRRRHNALEDGGWLVRRFTDRQVRQTPAYVVASVRRAIARVARA